MIKFIYKKIIVLLLMGLFVFSGCGDDSVSLLKSSEQDMEEKTESGNTWKQADSEEEQKKTGLESTEDELKESDADGGEETEKAEDTKEVEEAPKAEDVKEVEDAKEAEEAEGTVLNSESKAESEMVFVDVCGAVNVPGVYQLPVGSRVFQAVEMAGGFREDAERYLINQADIVSDGQQIRIFTREEARSMEIQEAVPGEASQENTGEEEARVSDQVNINRADKTVLMTIPGIGESKAEAIIAYRNIHGNFSSVEELMQVEGIKEKTYEKLKDKITVD